ncbi:MAG: OmpA family protein [Rhodobacteraceae bacterium]|nr:OmpA family protein [Paracoccaceae bacterium]
MIRAAIFLLGLMLTPLMALAVDLSLPGGAHQLSVRSSAMDSYNLPSGPFADGKVPFQPYEGSLNRQTWRLDGTALTTLQLMSPLRDQLEAAGFTILFECWDKTCGGFDFRFDIEIVSAPDMFVDVRNYRFLSAVKGNAEAVSLLASVNRNAAYLQIIQVGPMDSDAIKITPDQPNIPAKQVETEVQAVAALIELLKQNGHVVLGDLVFNTGAAQLDKGPFASLALLAGYLADNPEQRIAVVGHTDSVGSLDTNIALSKHRAAAVRDRLVEMYKIDPKRIQAEGMGYLAPIASNLTTDGRDANRRVEVVLLSQ